MKGSVIAPLKIADAAQGLRHVFVHDLTIETPERRFVAQHFPEARFSDWRGFSDVATTADLISHPAAPRERRPAGLEVRRTPCH